MDIDILLILICTAGTEIVDLQLIRINKGEDSFLVSWGDGRNGQLGDNKLSVQLGPVKVMGGLERKKIQSISVGR